MGRSLYISKSVSNDHVRLIVVSIAVTSINVNFIGVAIVIKLSTPSGGYLNKDIAVYWVVS